MIYFGRHPKHYGTQQDDWLKAAIVRTFHKAVCTPRTDHYSDILKMFDILCDASMGVFQTYSGNYFDCDTLTHLRVMWKLKKPVYLIRTDGTIIKLETINWQ